METPEPPKKTALIAAAEFLKYTIAFGTGTLVFSAGLVGEKVALPSPASPLLIATWILLTISVVSGVLAYSRIPIQLAEQKYDLEDRYFTFPGRIHQITFLLGIACLGLSLVLILKVPTEYKILSAQQAINKVIHQLPSDIRILKVEKVESIKGLDESKPALPIWHVQIEVEKVAATSCENISILQSSGIKKTTDYFIDAKTGEMLKVP